MEELVFVLSLTYIAFGTAVFIVLINLLVDNISDFASNIIEKRKMKKYEKYIKSLPNGDYRKSLYKIGEALKKIGTLGQTTERNDNDSVDCMGR